MSTTLLKSSAKPTGSKLLAALEAMVLIWEKPLAAACLAGLIYLGIASLAGTPWRVTDAPYFNYLADAFLHGQLHLRLLPENLRDLSLFEGRYYLYWGPLPAILVLPFVAVFGVGFSDILQSIVIGCANVALFALLLRAANHRGLLDLSTLQRGMLVMFLALGTALTALPALGRVWYMLSLEAFGFALLAYLAAFTLKEEKAFFWTGAGMAAILASRPSVVFVAVFLVWYLLRSHWTLGFKRVLRLCLVGVLPALVTLALLGVYNLLRFGSPLDNGLDYHLMNPMFEANYAEYGAFHPYYIAANFYYNYLHYPFNPFSGQLINAFTGSLFLLSPVFFAGLYALWQDRHKLDTWFLLLAVLLGNIPVLMVMGPGSVHFGPRYTLDFTVPLLLLTGMGIRRWRLGWLAGLLIISIVHFIIGSLVVAVALR